MLSTNTHLVAGAYVDNQYRTTHLAAGAYVDNQFWNTHLVAGAYVDNHYRNTHPVAEAYVDNQYRNTDLVAGAYVDNQYRNTHLAARCQGKGRRIFLRQWYRYHSQSPLDTSPQTKPFTEGGIKNKRERIICLVVKCFDCNGKYIQIHQIDYIGPKVVLSC